MLELTTSSRIIPLRLTVAAASALALLGVAPSAAAQCPADINADRRVDNADLGSLLSAWGSGGGPADIDADGDVGSADLGILLSGWGDCPAVTPDWATLIEAAPNPAVVTDPAVRLAIEATGLAWRVRDTATQIEMILVPGGTFNMGCSASAQYGCNPDEFPVRPVTLTNAFYIGRFEVTQAQWTARMGSNPSFFRFASANVPAKQVPNRPVEQVSWNMVAGPGGFLQGTGLRLPTEAEWEYACRGGTTTAFHGSSTNPGGTNTDFALGEIAWYWGPNSSQGLNHTWPVGRKRGNGFGLHDMHGNVYEWVSDFYSSTYYASGPSVNPVGPATASLRVNRGGGWDGFANYCRSSFRNGGNPGSSSLQLGFRVARNP